MNHRWTVLRNTWSLTKRHILFVRDYSDLKLLQHDVVSSVEFIVFLGEPTRSIVRYVYKLDYLICKDEMQDFRQHFKTKYKFSYIGHIFAIPDKQPTYNMLTEWLVCNIFALQTISTISTNYFEPPHVVVFDMDSTLITDEEEVRIRDPAIYAALDELKTYNCVLCLWSYGDREHVVESLNKVGLGNYFKIILSGGRRVGEYKLDEEEDRRYNVLYDSTPFYLNMTHVKNIPKSPRVVLWYLINHNIVFFKSITLVDDLFDNNIYYDNFVNLNTCPVPVNDWDKWHSRILRYIVQYDNMFNRC
nr:putative 38.0 kda protein in P143-LEF5 intergenic region [Cydia pomonella granulovirus]WOZ30312.1 putative 38.0 kda protein in P143-LEF5 intergenic region [Cydia pomonella granulovirus]WOZ44973.1 putative 38.0 kDa protein in P143-LEF5 intergenic region [Cydia pomonella granulovirus]WOZ45109.1 putative 38.0 kDa protein in P143-LEF5 intergenic region [Cydia pomonella granulovirus]WOZ45207.1 putative 38.0 kDa protein in P143-LEF5 intergenic region [Cydia pomonella granulovirus]